MSYPESFKKPISLDEALKISVAASKPTNKTEMVSTHLSNNRILAEDIKATLSVPPFARSAMDGFAVRASDVQNASQTEPVTLRVVQEIFAGTAAGASIRKGECAAIATGGMLPKGVDSIVMIENTSQCDSEGYVNINFPAKKGQHVISVGSDIKKGRIVAKKSEQLTPSKIGAISAIGKRSIKVYRKPRIVIMPTGDEIIRPGRKLRSGQIYDVNTFTLHSIISSFGGDACIEPIIEDNRRSIIRALRSHSNHELIILSGGSSVGEKDLIVNVLRDIGEVLFHGVAIKPGKPTLLGRIRQTLVMGMPGHPTSCLSNAYLFLGPMIRKIGRMSEERGNEVLLRLAEDVHLPKDRALILPIRIQGDLAVPTFKESSAITSMVNADGYAILQPKGNIAGKGSQILVHLY
ncbi:MAG: molybdopterin molybdotransferase MoeA [Thermoplasmata archaeon]|nr:molybdopterin molybdotransferase MoeA [Thermoplasmata archaeon]